MASSCKNADRKYVIRWWMHDMVPPSWNAYSNEQLSKKEENHRLLKRNRRFENASENELIFYGTQKNKKMSTLHG